MKSKILTALLSLLIAFALWSYVVTVEMPESDKTYYNIPVVLDGQDLLEERNLMILSSQDFRVNLTLSGYRTDLNKLDSSNITLLADLSRITEPGVHTLEYSVSFPGSAQTGTIHTITKDPQTIQITVAQRSQKEVPVEVIFAGSLPADYTYDRNNVTLDNNSVTISGPKDVVDQIAKACITIDLTDQTQTITDTFRHTLCGEDGEPIADVSAITVNLSDIKATVTVHKLKEIPLRLDIVPGGGITLDMATVTLDKTTIKVSGSEATLENLEEIFLGTIDLSKFTAQTPDPVFTITLPDNVKNVSGIVEVTADVEIPALSDPEFETRKYIVKNFRATGVPTGMKVEFLTEQLVIELRGWKKDLDQLKPDNIVLVVDFTGAQAGSASYTATIRVSGVENIGVVGEAPIVNARVEDSSAAEES